MTISQELNISELILPGIAQGLVNRARRPEQFPGDSWLFLRILTLDIVLENGNKA